MSSMYTEAFGWSWLKLQREMKPRAGPSSYAAEFETQDGKKVFLEGNAYRCEEWCSGAPCEHAYEIPQSFGKVFFEGAVIVDGHLPHGIAYPSVHIENPLFPKIGDGNAKLRVSILVDILSKKEPIKGTSTIHVEFKDWKENIGM